MHHRPGNEAEERRAGMEADIRTVLEGRNDQKDDGRDDGDVGKAAGGVVRDTGRIRIGHDGSFEAGLHAWLGCWTTQESTTEIVSPAARIRQVIIAQVAGDRCCPGFRRGGALHPIQWVQEHDGWHTWCFAFATKRRWKAWKSLPSTRSSARRFSRTSRRQPGASGLTGRKCC